MGLKRTTVFAEERLLDEIRRLSDEEDRSMAELVREAMEEYLSRKRKPARRISFVGIGESARGDVAEKHEDLLWRKRHG